MLFEDTELFTSGNRGRIIYDLQDAEIRLIDAFFNKDQSDYYYKTFLGSTNWSEYEMNMYDKNVKAPRHISWTENLKNGSENSAQVLTKDLNTVQSKVEKETNLAFNAVLLNLFRSGNDSVAWPVIRRIEHPTIPQ